MYPYLPVLLFLIAAHAPGAAPAPAGDETFADSLYAGGKFRYAALEYQRLLQGRNQNVAQRERFQVKLALAQMRMGSYRSAMDTLPLGGGTFAARYLRLYASLRTGLTQNALYERSRIRADNKTSPIQNAETELLVGAILFENGRMTEAREHYQELRRQSEDEQIRKVTTDVLVAINRFEQTDTKRPWLAGVFSAVLPGAGQFYANHEADAVSAFFFNAMFLGSAAVIYDLETRADASHSASVVFGLVGLVFYSANIVGAITSARRYNVYQERRFQQDLRDTFLNLDRAERVARVQFRTSLP